MKQYKSKIEKGIVSVSYDCPCGWHTKFIRPAKELHTGQVFVCANCCCISLEVWLYEDGLWLVYGDYVKQMKLLG